MDLVEEYSGKICPDTSSADRLALSVTLLADVSRQMTDGVQHDKYTVAEIVRILLKITLDSKRTTPQLREWLLSDAVRDLVLGFTAGLGTTSAVQQGIIRAVSEKGVGFDEMLNFVPDLLCKWFMMPYDTLAPTFPGFLLGLFQIDYLCGDRQQDVCGNRRADQSITDVKLLPLVSGALHIETKDSINMGDNDEYTALHFAASMSRYPQVTRALLRHPDIDVNVINCFGKSPLTLLVYDCSELYDSYLDTACVLLERTDTNVTILDNSGKTVLDHCLGYLGYPEDSVQIALQLICQICQHGSVTKDMISSGLERLLGWEVTDNLGDICNDVLVSLAANEKFELNKPLKAGKNVCHLAALKGNDQVVAELVKIQEFDPRVKDRMGNTVLHYVCEKMTPEKAIEILICPEVTWDYTVNNIVQQTVLDYYMASDTPKNPMLKLFLEQHSPGSPAALPEVGPTPARQTVDRAAREIRWTPEGAGAAQVNNKVLPTTQDFVNTKLDGFTQNKIFRLTSAKKGKACIIRISEFLVGTLQELKGYNMDSQMLAELWTQLGYEVMVPRCEGNWHLTAEEVQNALREFSEKLEEEDPSAVICLLSHGGQGYIYGSDGKTASLKDLFNYLDNEKCPRMKKKPKIAIVQACAGSGADYGVAAGPSSPPLPEVAYSAANEPQLPTMSDLIICSPALPGYESYVRNRGSVFITNLVKIFASQAKEDDIHTLMTWVNQAVSIEDIAVHHQTDDCKQMSRVESCLTKLLYFFPCPDGRNSQDWCTEGTGQ